MSKEILAIIPARGGSKNGAASYAVKTNVYLETGSLYGTKCVAYEMLPEDSVDIDAPLDIYLVKAMMQYKKEKGQRR